MGADMTEAQVAQSRLECFTRRKQLPKSSARLSLLFQKFLDFRLENRQISFHDVPHTVPIDAEIIMNSDIPKSAHVTPFDFGVGRFKLIGDPSGGFGQYLLSQRSCLT